MSQTSSAVTLDPTHLPAFAPQPRTPYQRYDLAELVGTMTEEEFAAFDLRAREKYQLIAGKVVKMPGSSLEHNLIQADLTFEVNLALRTLGSVCDVLGSDQKVAVAPQTIYYPDLIIVCGAPLTDEHNALTNPVVIFEVLSPSTERDDRTDKFTDYQRIESLLHYVLVEQDRPAMTHYGKLENGLWAILGTHILPTDTLRIRLDEHEIAIPLERIYRRVFPQDSANRIA
jgi:Uma2 family endonuclease